MPKDEATVFIDQNGQLVTVIGEWTAPKQRKVRVFVPEGVDPKELAERLWREHDPAYPLYAERMGLPQ